jgi:alkylation response protein AidB-like acyl-CoA dehydrogenase
VNFGLTDQQRVLVERVEHLVKGRIAPRASHYDLTNEPPVDDIQDLHNEGWLLANLDRTRGGLGYGLYGDDPLAFFSSTSTSPMATRQRLIAFRSTTMR